VVLATPLVLFGTAADATVVGAPLGLLSQASGGVGVLLGGAVAGIGFLGKAAGVCH
jgi:hypothetical protein